MDFHSVKEDLMAEARRVGLEEYEVFFMESSECSAETLKDEISSFSSGVGGGVCFRCVVNGHMGSASGECLTPEEMKALVGRAMENAGVIENDDNAILYEGSEHYETVTLPDLYEQDTAKLKQTALDIQRTTYEQDPAITDGTQSGVFTSRIYMELINSKGLHLQNTVSMTGAYVQAVVEKDGEAQEAFAFSLNMEQEALTALSRDTVREACSKLGATEIPSGRYDLIIDGKQMRSLLSTYASVFSAKNAQKGLSLLKGKEGQPIAAEIVTLIDDPMREGCPVQTSFDGEGVATYRKNVIEQGVLTTLLYDLATADRAGVRSTGNGQRAGYAEGVNIRPYSFYIAPGEQSDLFAKMGDGIYVTELKGLHAGCDAVTGDFSIESAGYLVQNGKIERAVKSFTVAGNFFDLLKGIEGLGDQVKFGVPGGFTVYGSPDVWVRNMSVAGK